MCQRDDLITSRPHADQRHWHTDLILDESQVVDCQLWKILSSTSADSRGSPTGERLVNRPYPRESVRMRGNGVDGFTADLIGDAYVDRLEDVEDVKERERDVGNAVQSRYVSRRDCVEPPCSAWPSGRGAVFMSTIADQ
jgi:hypothetical protein